ncbi:MAG: hypothetical protein LBN34_07710 [Clostridiales Family XIII bacterium]|jgi:hypothetical protein|nr:hypothetical protein [Clostridiales Family XIII bacterium]
MKNKLTAIVDKSRFESFSIMRLLSLCLVLVLVVSLSSCGKGKEDFENIALIYDEIIGDFPAYAECVISAEASDDCFLLITAIIDMDPEKTYEKAEDFTDGAFDGINQTEYIYTELISKLGFTEELPEAEEIIDSIGNNGGGLYDENFSAGGFKITIKLLQNVFVEKGTCLYLRFDK